jgi:hypothetical protein
VGRGAGKKQKDGALSLASLRALDAANIFLQSVPKMQGRFARLLAKREQARIISTLTQQATDSREHRDVKQLARFLEGARKHASHWIRAPLEDEECHLLNGHFRIAVALRLGVNPFANVSPGQKCSWCSEEVGDDLIAHTIECSSARKGDNNRRLASLFKAIGHGQVLLHPRLLTVFGCGAEEPGYVATVRAKERRVGVKVESVEQNQRRQVDIGLIGVLERDEVLAIDMTVSDGGGSKPQLPYVPGELCEKKRRQRSTTSTTAKTGGSTALRRNSWWSPATTRWVVARKRRRSLRCILSKLSQRHSQTSIPQSLLGVFVRPSAAR